MIFCDVITLSVTVSKDEIWQRDAAVGKCPVSPRHSKTDTHCHVYCPKQRIKVFCVLKQDILHTDISS